VKAGTTWCRVPLVLAAGAAMLFLMISPAPGGEAGIACGGSSWYFAEGYTGGDFDTWILIQNPNEADVLAHLRFFTPAGEPVSMDVILAGESRYSVYVNAVPGLENMEVATEVKCEAGGVICERAMYFSYDSGQGERAGGHASIGSSRLSNTWYLPEGYTGGGFDTYVLLMNPGTEDATDVHLKLMKPGDGRYYMFKTTVPAGRRVTVKVDDLVYTEGAENVVPAAVGAAGAGEGGEEPSQVTFDQTDVSVMVCSDKPIVAERAMYFDYYGRAGGSSSIGAPCAAPEWYLPEGYTGGEFDTWILAMNPNSFPVDITYTFYSNQPGFQPISVTHENVAPWSRDTIHVDDVAGLEGTDISTKVTAVKPVQLQAATAGAEKYALLYGIDGDAEGPAYAVEDMYDIKHRLVDYCGFSYSNMRYRADDQATLENLQADVQWLSQAAGPEDLVFFLFAGPTSSDAEGDYLDFYNGSLSGAELDALLDQVQSGSLVGLIDADNAGAFLPDLQQDGRVFMAACGEGESSHEYLEGDFSAACTDCGNSAFAYYFVEGLTKKEADTDGDDLVSAEEVFQYLVGRVSGLVQEKDGESQVPELSDLVEGEVELTVEEVPANIVAERSVYFRYGASSDGHTSIGTSALHDDWFLAEGYTGGGFDTYVLVVNPCQAWQKIDAVFMTPEGTVVERQYEVPPMYRLTIKVDDVDPSLSSTDVSTRITASPLELPAGAGAAAYAAEGACGVAVERAMYFTYRDPQDGSVKRGGSCSIGYGS
jgi:hypothetical protein